MASVAGPGDTILIAANAHRAERTYALATGHDAVIVPVQIDEAWDIEHGVEPQALSAALAAPSDCQGNDVHPTYFEAKHVDTLWFIGDAYQVDIAIEVGCLRETSAELYYDPDTDLNEEEWVNL